MLEKILIRRLPIKAEVKLSIVMVSLTRSVNINMAALITKIKRPKVRITAGKVNNFRSDPITVLIKPKRAATQK